MVHLLYQDDSSMFRAKIREEDLKPEEALQNIQDKLDELARKQLLEEAQGLDKAQKFNEAHDVEEEVCQGTHEEFALLLDEVELFVEANNTLNPFEELLKRICSILERAVEYVVHPATTEKKEGWLFSLLRKFLSQRLSWEEMLDAEIAELKHKLENDDLSAEERAEIMKRLKVLQEIKLHKITAIGLIIGILASFIGFSAAVARSGEIVRNALEKLSQVQEDEQKKCEKNKETENCKAEDQAKEKEREEENKRKCNELRESIFKELSEKQISSESVIGALILATVWLNDMGLRATGILDTPLQGKAESGKSTVKNSKGGETGKDPTPSPTMLNNRGVVPTERTDRRKENNNTGTIDKDVTTKENNIIDMRKLDRTDERERINDKQQKRMQTKREKHAQGRPSTSLSSVDTKLGVSHVAGIERTTVSGRQ